jgi:hypothetical protein
MPGTTSTLRIGLPAEPTAAQAALRHALAHVHAYLEERPTDPRTGPRADLRVEAVGPDGRDLPRRITR